MTSEELVEIIYGKRIEDLDEVIESILNDLMKKIITLEKKSQRKVWNISDSMAAQISLHRRYGN